MKVRLGSSRGGFATVLLMTLLPVLLAFGGMTLFSFSILKQDMGTLNVCRAVGLDVQGKVGKILEKLLKLNPKALRLRADEEKAEARLEAALESGLPPAITAAEVHLAFVQGQRVLLAFEQKALIASANALLTEGGIRGTHSISQEWNSHGQPMTTWLTSKITGARQTIPQLAVVPDMPDTAPAYKPDPDFEDKQTWSQSWNVSLRVTGTFRNFIPFATTFRRSCATSLYPEGEKWTAKLKADDVNQGKSFSKGLF